MNNIFYTIFSKKIDCKIIEDNISTIKFIYKGITYVFRYDIIYDYNYFSLTIPKVRNIKDVEPEPEITNHNMLYNCIFPRNIKDAVNDLNKDIIAIKAYIKDNYVVLENGVFFTESMKMTDLIYIIVRSLNTLKYGYDFINN